MPIDSGIYIAQLTRHSSERTEVNLSRGELLKYVSVGLEEIDPKAARAIKTIADDIVRDCEFILDEINLLMNEFSVSLDQH